MLGGIKRNKTMAWSSNDQYKVVADKIVSSDPDIILSVSGGVYINSIDEANRVATLSNVGGGGGPLSTSSPEGGDNYIEEGYEPLDLTKSVHRLNGANGTVFIYSLADGVEGQIIYLVPNTQTYYLTSVVRVDNARVLGNNVFDTATLYQEAPLIPFYNATDESTESVITLIFTDGAWQSSGGLWDVLD
jgi:hypothetical protein